MLSRAKVAGHPDELREVFLEAIYRIPEGEHIKQCLQCGTCSASCPASYAMDYTPREIIASLRAGQLEKVLQSNTVWLCASCYACTVRCPARIRFTDVMYELKRLSALYHKHPEDRNTRVMSEQFAKMVDKKGRLNESRSMMGLMIRTNPLKLVSFAPVALKLFLRHRLPLTADSIEGIEDLQRMSKWIDTGFQAQPVERSDV